jgi:hypothetical protein
LKSTTGSSKHSPKTTASVKTLETVRSRLMELLADDCPLCGRRAIEWGAFYFLLSEKINIFHTKHFLLNFKFDYLS